MNFLLTSIEDATSHSEVSQESSQGQGQGQGREVQMSNGAETSSQNLFQNQSSDQNQAGSQGDDAQEHISGEQLYPNDPNLIFF